MRDAVLGVAGVGLIGGSIALGARAAGARVIGFDRDAAVLDAARAAGAIDEVASDIETLARRSQIVALALPIDALIAVLETTDALAEPALVFDVASVKAPVARAGRRFPRFVPSHPLAGREVGGFSAADAALFRGRAWVVDADADPDARRLLETAIAALGAHAFVLGASEHDRLVAVTSHLPQVLSVVLGARLATVAASDRRVYEVCGPGIESMLRLARSPSDLWTAIARANAAALAVELEAVAETLRAIAAELGRGDVAALADAFVHAGEAAAALESR